MILRISLFIFQDSAAKTYLQTVFSKNYPRLSVLLVSLSTFPSDISLAKQQLLETRLDISS